METSDRMALLLRDRATRGWLVGRFSFSLQIQILGESLRWRLRVRGGRFDIDWDADLARTVLCRPRLRPDATIDLCDPSAQLFSIFSTEVGE